MVYACINIQGANWRFNVKIYLFSLFLHIWKSTNAVYNFSRKQSSGSTEIKPNTDSKKKIWWQQNLYHWSEPGYGGDPRQVDKIWIRPSRWRQTGSDIPDDDKPDPTIQMKTNRIRKKYPEQWQKNIYNTFTLFSSTAQLSWYKDNVQYVFPCTILH